METTLYAKVDLILAKLDAIHADIKAATPSPECAWDQRVRTPIGDGVVTKRAGCVGVNLDDGNQPECFFDEDSVKPIPEDDLEREAEELPAPSFHCTHQAAAEDGTPCCGYGLEDRQVIISCEGRRERGNCPKPVAGGPESEQPTEEPCAECTHKDDTVDYGTGDCSDFTPAEQPKPEAKPLEWRVVGNTKVAQSKVWHDEGTPLSYSIHLSGVTWLATLDGGELTRGTMDECEAACNESERQG